MRLVEEAVESIPAEFRERLANVDFVVEETPRGDEVPGGELRLGL
jgi:predicted Zn-dependent protease with MMP-like domain